MECWCYFLLSCVILQNIACVAFGCIVCNVTGCDVNSATCIDKCEIDGNYYVLDSCLAPCESHCEYCAANLRNCLVCGRGRYGDSCGKVCRTKCPDERCDRLSGVCERGSQENSRTNLQSAEQHAPTDQMRTIFVILAAAIVSLTLALVVVAIVIARNTNKEPEKKVIITGIEEVDQDNAENDPEEIGV